MKPLLETDNLIVEYSAVGTPVRALDGVSISIKPGEMVAVQGPSGCGKSTLLFASGGLLFPDDGRVSVKGVDIYTLSQEERVCFRAKEIGFVFQQFHLIPYLNVVDNILLPTIAWRPEDEPQRAVELAERLGLSKRLKHTPSELSTGERQRVGLARALLNRPSLILADEPTGNLDADNAGVVMDELGKFVADGGGVLIVTHDEKIAARAGRRISMCGGRIVAYNTKSFV